MTATGAGDCAITASFEYEGQTYSDTCAVTVEGATVPGVTLNVDNFTVEQNGTFQLVAETVPPNQPVAYYIEDYPDYASVDDNGLVTASSTLLGNFTVTCEMEYEGEIYTAFAHGEVVEPLPLIINLTSAEYWNNPDKWVMQEYPAEERKTYISFNDSDPIYGIELHYNPAGTNTSLYADLRPSLDGIQIDSDKNYELVIGYDNEDDLDCFVKFGGLSGAMFDAGGQQYSIPSGNDSFNIPLNYLGGSARLFTMQVSNNEAGNVEKVARITIELVEV